MGIIYKFLCEKCGYEFDAFLGMGGFSYWRDYEKIFDKAIAGCYGEEIQKFLKENPDAVIDASNIFVKCRECQYFEVVPNLTTYLPNDENFKPNEEYKFISEYHHKCKNCGGEVEIFTFESFNPKNFVGKLKCPNCHEFFIEDELHGGIWD